MTEDSFLTLQTAIAGVIASACADPNDGIAWAAERDVHMLTASQIIDDFLDPEVDAAEKRGAVKALRKLAQECAASAAGESASNHYEDLTWRAKWLRRRAAAIEAGDVTP